MTDTELLEEYIRKSGYKKSFLANKLGISLNAFGKKIKGKCEFKASEILALCTTLGIATAEEKDNVFFAEQVN